MDNASVRFEGACAHLEGDITFRTVMPIRHQVERAIAAADGHFQIDFRAVAQVDTAALSFWLCCQRLASSRAVQLEAVQVPETLKSIARLVGLDESALLA